MTENSTSSPVAESTDRCVFTGHVKSSDKIRAVSCGDKTVTLLCEGGKLLCVDTTQTALIPRSVLRLLLHLKRNNVFIGYCHVSRSLVFEVFVCDSGRSPVFYYLKIMPKIFCKMCLKSISVKIKRM